MLDQSHCSYIRTVVQCALSSFFPRFVLVQKDCVFENIVLISKKCPYSCLFVKICGFQLSWLISTKFQGYCAVIGVTALRRCVSSVAITLPVNSFNIYGVKGWDWRIILSKKQGANKIENILFITYVSRFYSNQYQS